MTTLVGKSRKEGGSESRVGMGVQRKGQIYTLEDPRENTVKSCRKIVQKIRRDSA